MNNIKSAALAIVVVSAGLRLSAQNVLINGSFETGTFTGWDITAETGNLAVSSSEGSTDGIYSAIFNTAGSPNGGLLSQTVPTTIGDFYELKFSFGAYGSGGMQQLAVDAIGASTLLNVRAAAPTASIPTTFGAFQYFFQPDSSSTTISFTDIASGDISQSDGVLDNVVLLHFPSVPEPSTLALTAMSSVAGLLALRRRK